MKRILAVLMSVVVMLTALSLPCYAASNKSSVEVHVKKYDGYTRVWFETNDEDVIIRYTTNGEKPTSESKKYKEGSKLRVKKNTTLRYRVWKSGSKTKYYTCKITVNKATSVKTENSNATAFEAKLDNVKLNPVTTGTELDNYVEKALDEAITKDMSTSEKVRACYDWLVKNVEYKVSGEPIVARYDMRGLSSWEDYILVEQALFAFKKGYGVCDNFAAAFVVMCRAIGVEAYWATGKCKSSAGGYTGHSWAVIIVDDELKQYDPMLDASYAQKNDLKISYKYYEREADTTLYKNRELVPFNDFD